MKSNKRTLIVGKRGILSWVEDLALGFKQANLEAQIFWINPTPRERFDKRIKKKRTFESEAFNQRLISSIKEYRPDMILFMNIGLTLPEHIFMRMKELKNPPLLVGWICDCQGYSSGKSSLYDHMFYFDTHMKSILLEQYEEPSISYLPLAVNPARYFPQHAIREPQLLFLGSCTPERLTLIEAIRKLGTPITLIGPQKKFGIKTHRKSPAQFNALYNSFKGILNINQLPNTYNGLNLRTFEATATHSLLITQNCSDINLCFGNDDLLRYAHPEEAAELFMRSLNDTQWAEQICKNGFSCTLNNHTYRHRANTLLEKLDMI